MALAYKQLDTTSDTDSLADSTMSSMMSSTMENPDESDDDDSPHYCPSDNIGVRSMSFDFPCEKCIGELEAKAFAAILHEAVANLEILRGTVQMSKSHEDSEDSSKSQGLPSRITVRKKNSCSAKNEKEMFFGEDAGFEPVELSVRDKLLRDSDLAYNVLHNVACELESNNSCDFLKNEVGTIIRSKEKECKIKVNLKIWSDLVSKLRSLQKNLENDFETNKEKYLKEINELANNIDNSYCANMEELDYIVRKEKSKLEQQNLRLSMQEDEVLNEIKKLEKERAIDAKVTRELCNYWQSVINSHENEIVNWTNRYNTEIEKRQTQINALEENIEETKKFLVESRKLYNERQIVVDKYLEEKKKESDEMEYWKNINDWATVIQAVWRGYMVRHKLGRFAKLGRKRSKRSKKSKKKKLKNRKNDEK